MSCSFLKNNLRHIFLVKNNSHGTENTKLPSILSTFYRSYNTKLFQFRLKGLRAEGQTSSSKYRPMPLYHYPTILGRKSMNMLTQSARKKEHTAQKIKFSMKGFFSKCDQILISANFIFCAETPFFKNTSMWLLLTGKHLC